SVPSTLGLTCAPPRTRERPIIWACGQPEEPHRVPGGTQPGCSKFGVRAQPRGGSGGGAWYWPPRRLALCRAIIQPGYSIGNALSWFSVSSSDAVRVNSVAAILSLS